MTKIEIVKAIYAALNRDDIPGVLEFFASGIEWIEPEGFSTPGTYRGLAEVSAHFSKGRSTWADWPMSLPLRMIRSLRCGHLKKAKRPCNG